jgi:hypothetical protein
MDADEPVVTDSEKLFKTLESIDNSLVVIKFWVMTWSILFALLVVFSLMCNRRSSVEIQTSPAPSALLGSRV